MKRVVWTPQEEQVLRDRYPHESTVSLAAAMGRTPLAVYNRAYSMGLRKSAHYMGTQRPGYLDGIRGGATRFKPGQVPWNKGTHYIPGGRSAETRFKKGRPAHEARNYLPIGSLRINADGYLERKMTDDPSLAPVRRWVPVHRLVWEAANGPVPHGHIVVFKGARTAVLDEITLDRVECITRAEHARRNHPRSRSPELGKLVQLKGAITRQVNRINRETQKATP